MPRKPAGGVRKGSTGKTAKKKRAKREQPRHEQAAKRTGEPAGKPEAGSGFADVGSPADPKTLLPEESADERRRWQVAVMLRQGFTQREMREVLKVAPATITADVRAIRELWRRDHIEAAEYAMAVDAERVDRLMRQWFAKATGGDLDATRMVVELMRRRAEMFGYDAPKRITLEALVQRDVNLRMTVQLQQVPPSQLQGLADLRGDEFVAKLSELTGTRFLRLPPGNEGEEAGLVDLRKRVRDPALRSGPEVVDVEAEVVE